MKSSEMASPLNVRALLVFLALFAPGCDKTPLPPPPPTPVTVAPVVKSSAQVYLDTFGNCATVASVTIVPQVTGLLAKTLFTEGAAVKAGDALFEIDPAPYQAAVQQAQGSLASAQATLLNTNQDFQRQQQLFTNKVVDIQAMQNAQVKAQTAQADVLVAEAALQAANISLGYCSIKSPISGRTGPYLINTGNLVTANISHLVNIQTISPIYVDYTISEAQLAIVRKYLKPEGLPVEITVPDNPGDKIPGSLVFLDNQIGSQTGTLALRALTPNEEEGLWPGLFVNVRLVLETIPEAILVPSPGVIVGQSGPYVFVLQADQTLALRQVKIGQREGTNTLIEQGLAEGENVVVSGQIGLAPGMKVAPAPLTPPTPPSSDQ